MINIYQIPAIFYQLRPGTQCSVLKPPILRVRSEENGHRVNMVYFHHFVTVTLHF